MKAYSNEHLFLLNVRQLKNLLKFTQAQADKARLEKIKWDTRVSLVTEIINWRKRK